jgi:hypothetical protein
MGRIVITETGSSAELKWFDRHIEASDPNSICSYCEKRILQGQVRMLLIDKVTAKEAYLCKWCLQHLTECGVAVVMTRSISFNGIEPELETIDSIWGPLDTERDLIDKSSWGAGSWTNEPDRVEWIDQATGMLCIASRHPEHGSWCGYVAINPAHPLHGKSFTEVNLTAHRDRVNFAGRASDTENLLHLTRPGEPELFWWFGFDCAHGGDYCPRLHGLMFGITIMPEEMKRDEIARLQSGGMVYRPLSYVMFQCTELALQLGAYEILRNTGLR